MTSRLPRIVLSLVAVLACGCFSPGGSGAGSSSGTGTGPGSSDATASTPTTGSGPTSGTDTSTSSSSGVASVTGETSLTDDTGVVTETSGTTGEVSATTGTNDTGDTDATGTTGAPVVCGDGVLAESEDCDDGNLIPDDGCNIACKRDALFVFLSSKSFPVSMINSLAGADEQCVMMAKMGQEIPAMARDSSYVAWLSDGVTHAGNRMGPSGLPYLRVDFVQVAESLSDLVYVDSELGAPINLDENGVGLPGNGSDCGENSVWTGTHPTGLSTTEHCTMWTSPLLAGVGTAGSALSTGNTWSEENVCACNLSLRLYCFELP